ncbi:Double-stranded RNA Hypothetical protein motif [Nesidiocoris tenuis]|uniref:DRBM domain-containing protein n=1 Tax=Nesidiocoris tenuis TaxID=355587 RepID=A0ABN7ALR0_9HEMI|nr:Double-stranded RNA Hypothetical protein motif [Nesidiocoris tenuis]
MISNQNLAHGVGPCGSSGLLLALVVIANVALIQGTYYNVPIDMKQIEEIFGKDVCITGHFEMAPTAPVSTTQMQDSHVSSSGEAEPGNRPASDENASQVLQNDGSSNLDKEKTPMCLVNELARFNKIEHQYRLTNEEGPPHKKKFTVTLKFGTEEYTADGASIKKAQHAAASIALVNTMYKHPPPKSSRSQRGAKSNITPTVELNALAMKRGEPTTYTLVETPVYNRGAYVNYCPRRMYNQPFMQPYPEYGFDRFGHPQRGKFDYRGAPRGCYNNYRMMEPGFYNSNPPLYKVLAKVGEREFFGEGTTAQAARHEAASKALQVLKNLPLEENGDAVTRVVTNEGAPEDPDSSTELKSPISLVHEIALKRNLPVVFEVISEKGQPHMRTFVTRCTVGDKFESIGEGNGKKLSKKRAAEKMLEQLRTLPPTTTVLSTGFTGSLSRMKRKPNANKKKSRNLIKDTTPSTGSTQQDQPKSESDTVEDMNPISRLIHIQQAKREKEPVYTLREERGMSRQKVFVMEVKMGEHSCTGTGSNKKIAKRKAAEGLLQQLGYISPTVNRTGHPLPPQNQPSNKVRFNEDNKPAASTGGSVGRQLVPGLLLMVDNNKASNGNPSTPHKGMALKTAAIAKEYLSNGNSPTADALAGNKRPKSGAVVRPTDQLLYLAQLLNIQVQFTDFPKGNHSEYLSLVSITTDPLQVCHGSGSSLDISHDQASLNALRCLSEMGLDSIAPAKKDQPTNNVPPTGAQTDNNIYLNLGHSISKETISISAIEMVGWSSLGRSVLRNVFSSKPQTCTTIVRGHRTLPIVPSNFQYAKFKDMLHFYAMLGIIPASILIFYTNVFIGPAKLAEIPEGYEPKHWEYYKHPITRFMARHIFTPPQQEYEKFMHVLYEEDEKMKIRALQSKVLGLMRDRADYQAYYYRQIDGKYLRRSKKYAEEFEETSGVDTRYQS